MKTDTLFLSTLLAQQVREVEGMKTAYAMQQTSMPGAGGGIGGNEAGPWGTMKSTGLSSTGGNEAGPWGTMKSTGESMTGIGENTAGPWGTMKSTGLSSTGPKPAPLSLAGPVPAGPTPNVVTGLPQPFGATPPAAPSPKSPSMSGGLPAPFSAKPELGLPSYTKWPGVTPAAAAPATPPATAPTPEQLAQFQSATGTTFKGNSRMDKDNMQRLIAGQGTQNYKQWRMA